MVVRFLFLLCVHTGRMAGFFIPAPPILTDVDIFEGKITPVFLSYYDCETVAEYSGKNANISPAFYDRKQLAEIMKIDNNELEKQWRSRILIENTPRGNIIMFYDAYKGGFSYYSDHTTVPIRVLNAVAMKYAMRFLCLDFFVDETVVEKNTSPLIRLLVEEDKEETDKKKRAFGALSANTRIDADKMPYVKQRVATPASHPSTTTAPSPPSPPTPEKRMNKFVHLGKINNFSILQRKPKRQIQPTYEDVGLFKNVNYDEYKRKQKKTL
jgi:hypothetical protein